MALNRGRSSPNARSRTFRLLSRQGSAARAVWSDLGRHDAFRGYRSYSPARFERPRRVVFGVVPKTSTGKIQKAVLGLRERVKSAYAIE